MAVAAFKSTSRRTSATAGASSDRETRHQNYQTSSGKALHRRSRSVSAAPRSHLDETTASTAESEFVNKRDNPLYWSANSVSPPEKDNENNEIEAKVAFNIASAKATAPSEDTRRGRSVSRDTGSVKSGSGIGRSLSRVDTGRQRRSLSRGPRSTNHFVNSESDADQEGGLLNKYRSRDEGNKAPIVDRKIGLVRGGSDASNQMRNFREKSNGFASKLPSSPAHSWEDGGFGSSVSEADERTIKAVCEQMKVKPFQGDNLAGDTSSRIYETVRTEVRRAILDIQNDLESAIRRSNASAIATANVTDIPPDLVSPGAVELVLDIRREYAHKLEQSQERARKLRADLAVEEQRGLELNRILKEVLPDPKALNGSKSRTGRKSSMERRKMSKRLTDEAMAYFDECVSLSTFDSSDFSSQDDPPIKLVGFNSSSTVDSATFPIASSNAAAAVNHSPNNFPVDNEEPSMSSHNAWELSATGSSKKPNPHEEVSLNGMDMQQERRSQFSFGQKSDDALEAHRDIRKYVRNFEKEIKVDTNSHSLRSNHYDMDEYKLHSSQQSLLFDMMLHKNRIESGGMLLCGGGIAISTSPFASLF